MRIAMIAALALSGCTHGAAGPDASELANIAPWNVVPKSSPRQLVAAFRQFCVEPSDKAGARDSALRNAGYVPVTRTGSPRVYLVDDRRPAIAVSQSMCMASARSRTGQTQRTRNFVAKTFPQARALDPTVLGRTIEQAWRVDAPEPAIVATRRSVNIRNAAGYDLILYRPSSKASI